MRWNLTREADRVLIEYEFENTSDGALFMCHPDPPYVTVEPSSSVRLWLGMYIIGPNELVEFPIVPEVVRLEAGERYHGSFALPLPLDEIHPFPRYEYTKKNLATSKSVQLEIGVFPADDRYPPPTVTEDGRQRMVAPYGWAAQSIRYVIGEKKQIALPILSPEIEKP